jgi:hypothetical protein
MGGEMKLNHRKFWPALLALSVALVWLLPTALNHACANCYDLYVRAVLDGKATWWPVYLANIVLIAGTGAGAYLLAKRRHCRRPWLWTVACVPFHVGVICYLWALEPVPGAEERGLADGLDRAPL